jgi:HAMP domain-containing protein
MGLKAKFNLVMLGAFVLGLALAAAFSWQVARQDARREVEQQAAIMLEQATAVRQYTDSQIAPLLADQNQQRFLPQTIPFYAAETTMRLLAKKFPDYLYKEAALNPTNPADRATDWEAGMIDAFRRDPTLASFSIIRDSPAGPILSIARPVRITDRDCLTCHSTPQAAPASMVDLYGSKNGFDWQFGAVEGAQIVSVPMQVALARGNQELLVHVGGLAAIFAVTLLLLNLLLHFVIIRPIRRISALAMEVSTGRTDAPEFTERGHDEIASLAASFNRMRRSLASAMRMLET